jgi:hypothetical protein
MENGERSSIAAFVSADTPDTEREEAHELELLRDGIAGRIPLDDLPAHIRDRVRLRQAGISVSPFAGARIA